MESRDLAIAALRVLSAWTHGNRAESDDLKALRTHALSDEVDLPPDELACRIIGRECMKVIQESQFGRKTIEQNVRRYRETA